MNISIFRPAKDFAEKEERFNVIHYSFKARIFMPLFRFFEKRGEWIIKRFLGKKLAQYRVDIPDEPYNANALIFYDALEETLQEWWFQFKGINLLRQREKERGLTDPEKRRLLELLDEWEDKKTRHWYRIPRMCRNLMLTVYLEDTAYREMINMFMFKLQGKMNEHYHPEIKHQFPQYTDSKDSYLPYFIEWMEKTKNWGSVTILLGEENEEGQESHFMQVDAQMKGVIEKVLDARKHKQDMQLVIDLKYQEAKDGNNETKNHREGEAGVPPLFGKGDAGDHNPKTATPSPTPAGLPPQGINPQQ